MLINQFFYNKYYACIVHDLLNMGQNRGVYRGNKTFFLKKHKNITDIGLC